MSEAVPAGAGDEPKSIVLVPERGTPFNGDPFDAGKEASRMADAYIGRDSSNNGPDLGTKVRGESGDPKMQAGDGKDPDNTERIEGGEVKTISVEFFVSKMEVVATRTADFATPEEAKEKIAQAVEELETEYPKINVDGYLRGGLDRIAPKANKVEKKKQRGKELSKRKEKLRQLVVDIKTDGEIDEEQVVILKKMGVDLGDFNGAVKMMEFDEVDDITEETPVEVEQPEQTWREYVDDKVEELTGLGGTIETQGLRNLVRELMKNEELALAKEIQDKIDLAEKAKTDLTPEQRDKVINQALVYIFTLEPEVRNIQDLMSRLETYSKGEFNKDYRFVLPMDLRSEIEKMGIENWIEVKNNVNKWSELLKIPADEVKPSSFGDERLFVSDGTEKFFAEVGSLRLPKDDDGNITTIRDMEESVSGAMMVLFGRFEDIGYADIVKMGIDERFKFYDQLGLNRYVAEAAMSIMMSNLMLSETKKAADPIVQLVARERKRIADFKKTEGDPYARLAVQDMLIEGDNSMLGIDGKLTPEGEIRLTERLQRTLPSRLIPTGLSGFGRDRLFPTSRGHRPSWLRWKVEHSNSIASRKAAGLNPGTNVDSLDRANDRQTRMKLLSEAFEVNTMINDTVKGDATIEAITKLQGKLKGYWTGTIKDAGWVTQDDRISYEFSLGTSGEKREVFVNGLISQTMIEVVDAYAFTHSILDTDNADKKYLSYFELMKQIDTIFYLLREYISEDEKSIMKGRFDKKGKLIKDVFKFRLFGKNAFIGDRVLPVWLTRKADIFTLEHRNALSMYF